MSEEKELSVEELTKKIADQEAAISNVVGELKEDREKRRLLAEENDTLKKALEDATRANATQQDPNDIASVVDSIVQKKLGERDASVAKSNKFAAIERFVAENKEFHPENDTTGKRREALEGALNRFNTSNLFSVDEFYSVIRDAATLLGVNTTPQSSSEVVNPYSTTTRSSIAPQVSTDTDVTKEEKSLYEANGWSKEKFLSLKARDPKFIANLVRLKQSL